MKKIRNLLSNNYFLARSSTLSIPASASVFIYDIAVYQAAGNDAVTPDADVPVHMQSAGVVMMNPFERIVG